jgi:hypothetical protein
MTVLQETIKAVMTDKCIKEEGTMIYSTATGLEDTALH